MAMILAVDPGTEKTGMALCERSGALVTMVIVPTADIEGQLVHWLESYVLDAIVCGNGTNHRAVYKRLVAAAKSLDVAVELVDERYTTEEARRRYWDLHKPRGLQKFLPRGMRVIDEAVDDITAWVIGERYCKEKG